MLPSMITAVAEDASEYVVPDTSTAELPAASVCVPMIYSEAGFAVRTVEPTVITGAAALLTTEITGAVEKAATGRAEVTPFSTMKVDDPEVASE